MGKIQQAESGKVGEQNFYRRDFPNISSNFERRTPAVHNQNQNSTIPKQNGINIPKVLPTNK